MKKLILAALFVMPVWVLGQDDAAAAPADAAPAKTEAAPAAAPAGDISVVDAKLGTGVENRDIQGEADSFKPDVGKVYCWSKIKGGEGSEITHAWYKGDQKVTEVKLNIKFASMRTWSYKTIPAGAEGSWRVDIVGPDGTVLKSLPFTVAQ
jgi:hypothetical protein